MAKYDLLLSTSLMNAAGSLGYTPPADHPDRARLGAFVTNPISLKPRQPSRRPQSLLFPGGFLLHTGYPNPGLTRCLGQYAAAWGRLDIPVIVHLLVDRVDQLPEMLARLEGAPGVMAVELGFPPLIGVEELSAFARSASGELPVILRLPLDRLPVLEEGLKPIADEYGIAAYSLGAPRGMLPDGETRLAHGRLYGPAIYPQALAAVSRLVASDVPVIGGGGIYSLAQAEAMIAVGAMAVQLDSVLWRGRLP